jgi:oxygen-independent coproporphyrinogen-3 oxidase
MTGLYIHIPFCVKRCPYCDFYSISNVGSDIISSYLDACLAEISSLPKVAFDTIYIGGGTPSFLGADVLGTFISSILKSIKYAGAEFTVEINPDSVDIQLCDMLASYPVTRVSMGVQSLDDDVLSLLGRIHSVFQSKNAYKLLRTNTKCDINLDLIYDIPTVPFETITDSLQKIIAMNPEHISAYSYTPDTGYLADSPSEEPFQMTTVAEILTGSGYPRYEVSNFAKEGKQSLHNLNYWRMGNYYGVGAASHSMINTDSGRTRYSHAGDVEDYIKQPYAKSGSEKIFGETILLENVVFGLRMTEGVKLHSEIPEKLATRIDFLVDAGLLTCVDGQITATEQGLLLLDSVMSHLWA